jgi:hypothetical protein
LLDFYNAIPAKSKIVFKLSITPEESTIITKIIRRTNGAPSSIIVFIICFLFTRKRSEKYRMSLIKTGVFDGNEKMVRLTISKDDYGDWCENTYTVIKDDGDSYSWHSGTSGYTCVSDQMRMRAQLMHDAKNELFKDN